MKSAKVELKLCWMFDRVCIVIVIGSLGLGYLLAYHETDQTRIWLYPGANYALDRDDWIVVRCGSGVQNVFPFPGVALLAICILIPIVWLISRFTGRALRANRESHNRDLKAAQICIFCGYDLRATPERCPECGSQVWPPADYQTDRITRK